MGGKGVAVVVKAPTKIIPDKVNCLVNPFTPMSDQERISPYNINTISCTQVMRIKKNII